MTDLELKARIQRWQQQRWIGQRRTADDERLRRLQNGAQAKWPITARREEGTARQKGDIVPLGQWRKMSTKKRSLLPQQDSAGRSVQNACQCWFSTKNRGGVAPAFPVTYGRRAMRPDLYFACSLQGGTDHLVRPGRRRVRPPMNPEIVIIRSKTVVRPCVWNCIDARNTAVQLNGLRS